MKTLSKFFLAVLLLTVSAIGWAACPAGFKNNYKGECVPLERGTRDADVYRTLLVTGGICLVQQVIV